MIFSFWLIVPLHSNYCCFDSLFKRSFWNALADYYAVTSTHPVPPWNGWLVAFYLCIFKGYWIFFSRCFRTKWQTCSGPMHILDILYGWQKQHQAAPLMWHGPQQVGCLQPQRQRIFQLFQTRWNAYKFYKLGCKGLSGISLTCTKTQEILKVLCSTVRYAELLVCYIVLLLFSMDGVHLFVVPWQQVPSVCWKVLLDGNCHHHHRRSFPVCLYIRLL